MSDSFDTEKGLGAEDLIAQFWRGYWRKVLEKQTLALEKAIMSITDTPKDKGGSKGVGPTGRRSVVRGRLEYPRFIHLKVTPMLASWLGIKRVEGQ